MVSYRLVLSAAFTFCAVHAAEHWQMQFFHDKSDSTFNIRDLQCPSTQKCIAVGVIEQEKHSKGASVVTSDGGAHWTYIDLEEQPVSCFFVDESLGFLVTTNGVWRTQESGRSWKKLKNLKGLERIWFQSATHGWAIGYPKAVYETTDGGKVWLKLAAAAKPSTQADETGYAAISFAGPDAGVIAGNWTPGQHSNLPAWMDPANERRRSMQRGATIFLRTMNGGKDWETLSRPGEGFISRLRLKTPVSALALFEFPAGDSPSGLFELDLDTRRATAVFRDPGKVVRDFTMLPDGDLLLAAVELPGRSSQIPIPGKLKILRSGTTQSWLDIPIDYRAVATMPVLAAADATHVWVATDTGMILKLVE